MPMCTTHTTFVPYAHAWPLLETFFSSLKLIQQTRHSSHAVILDNMAQTAMDNKFGTQVTGYCE
jgi:hypothetical protein